MSNQATAKGVLLTGAIAFMSAGATFLTIEKWWIGIIVALVGVGFIFAREYIKEI
jgi:hypothetical protein